MCKIVRYMRIQNSKDLLLKILQLLAMEIARKFGKDVCIPRNLVKL